MTPESVPDELDPNALIKLIEGENRFGRDIIEVSDEPGLTGRICEAIALAERPLTRMVLTQIFARRRDPAALPCLLNLLDDHDPEVVAAAGDAIGNCSYRQEIPAELREALGQRLLRIALNRDEEFPRGAAIYGLGLLGYRQAVQHLLPLLDDPERDIRWSTAEALAYIGDPAGEYWLKERRAIETDEAVRNRMNQAIAMFQDRRDEAASSAG